MFRLAKNSDMVDYRMVSPISVYPLGKHENWSWGLKSLGYMFVLQRIKELHINGGHGLSFLEAGAGYSNCFYINRPDQSKYTIMDMPGFYPGDQFRKRHKERSESKLIEGLVGDFNPNVKDESIDTIFSVSVLEHVPLNKIDDFVQDAKRMLKSGGIMLHSLDLNRNHKKIWDQYKNSLLDHGFQFHEEPEEIDYTQDGLFFEPLSIVFSAYEKSNDVALKSKAASKSQGTILISCIKP
jgi:SAM-dependent methyltransferase